MPPSAIVSITLSEPASKAAKGAADPSKTVNAPARDSRRYIPSGAFARAILLGGLDARRVVRHNAIPSRSYFAWSITRCSHNHFRSRIKECFVVGAGFGDMSSERAYIRTESLSA